MPLISFQVILRLVIVATSILLVACSKEPPKCSDESTFSILRSILLDQIGGTKGLTDTEIKEFITFAFPRATGFEEKIKKYSCNAKMSVGGRYELPIVYESQLDDKNEHIVSMGGIGHGDLLKFEITLDAEKENKATKSGSTAPQPAEKKSIASVAVQSSTESGSQCFSEAAITKAIGNLASSYGDVPSSVDCEKQVYGAGKLICQNNNLKLMDSLDSKAYVYALENGTKSEENHVKPPVDSAWIASVRNECKDETCLCAAFKAHTNESLGGGSPYPTSVNAPTAFAKPNEEVKLRAGTLTLKSRTDINPPRILLNGKLLLEKDTYLLTAEAPVPAGEWDAVLVMNNSGGTACPALYFFVAVNTKGGFAISPEFGTCSDLAKVARQGTKLLVTMPSRTGDAKYTFSDGDVFENGKLIAGKTMR